MTREEALALRSFKHGCMCGGYAHTMNGRDPARPHMHWCPQYAEHAAWYDALHPAAPAPSPTGPSERRRD